MGYGKGSYVMQMLEQLIGTDRITHAMREWIRVHPKGKAGEWEDFLAVVKKGNPDKPIETFAKDWLYTPGHAKLELGSIDYSAGSVKASIKFVGRSYSMPLDVLLELPGGNRKVETVWVTPKNGTAEIEVKCETKPELVSIDPYMRAYREFAKDERPVSIARELRALKVVRDPKHPEYWPELTGNATDINEADLEGKLLVGNPATMPAMKALFEKLGWSMKGNNLVWEDTQTDVRSGGGIALVDLGGGKFCGVAIGKMLHPAKYGKARSAILDNYGRFLKGKTEPKTAGTLTKRL